MPAESVGAFVQDGATESRNALAFNSSAFAASQIWRAIPAHATWVGTGNWSVSGVVTAPGNTAGTNNGDIATFNSAISGGFGSSGTPIVIDSGRTIRGITFDTAYVGAYTIGSNGGNALKLSNNGNGINGRQIKLTSAVAAVQIIAAPLTFVAPSSTNGIFGFTNNATSSAATLTISGTVTSHAARPATTLLDGTKRYQRCHGVYRRDARHTLPD